LSPSFDLNCPNLNQEAEAAAFWAPNDLILEEERLHKEREEASICVPPPPVALEELDSKKFKALETLLNQSKMYTKFLSEQMKTIEHQTEQEARRAAQEASGSTNEKGKQGSDGEPDSKKSRSSLTPTQVGSVFRNFPF
jgi:hypothetical protein